MTNTRKIIAIVGPTASGKTGIGVALAKEFNGEIISADSRQVYRGLDIGTGKDLSEYSNVKHHMIDIADPEQKMTLFDYLPLARLAIEDIFSRGKIPIIVGGTGLYIQGIVEGFALESKVNSPKSIVIYTREQLDQKTTEQLNGILFELDAEKAKTIDKKNRHRLIRAIEMAQSGERTTKVKPDFEVLQMAVDLPRAKLHENIDRRVDERFEAGMLEEVTDLLKSGIDARWLIGLGLEYRIITEYLLGISNFQFSISNQLSIDKFSNDQLTDNWKLITGNSLIFDDLKQKLKYRIHQFARRQITWFKRFPEINWLTDYNEFKRFTKIFLEH